MVTSQLLNHLRRAVKPDAQVLMIGDPDQLAPVGSGQPFTDLIDAGAVPVARLATVHRQAHGSRILEACDLVRAVVGGTTRPRKRIATMIWSGCQRKAKKLLADMCEELLVQLRASGTQAAEVTLVTPRVTGGTAGNVQLRTEELNRRLQRRLNPAAGLGGIAGRRPSDLREATGPRMASGTAPAAPRSCRTNGYSSACTMPTRGWWTASRTASLAYAISGPPLPGLAEPRHRGRRAPQRRQDADAPAAVHGDLAGRRSGATAWGRAPRF